jgi:hypothetical protein
MCAKLHRLSRANALRIGYVPQSPLSGSTPPHLLYANVRFDDPVDHRKVERLLRVIGSPWSEKRTLRFLQKYQPAFRQCLEWLSNGSHINFDLEDDDSGDFDFLMRCKWANQPEVAFLQRHGLDHGGVTLEPYYQEGSMFGGIKLSQRKPRDPLDPICWYLLSVLMWHGRTGVALCNYGRCTRFFRARRNDRGKFCSSACRAKFHQSQKTPEQKRKYMREYRQHQKLGRTRPRRQP